MFNLTRKADATRFEKWLLDANHPLTLRSSSNSSSNINNSSNSENDDDYELIVASDRLFARKFTFTKSRHLLARLFVRLNTSTNFNISSENVVMNDDE